LTRLSVLVAILVIVTSVGAVSGQEEPLDAEAILERVRATLGAESFHARVELEITISGTTYRYLMEVWTLGEDRALVRILEPEVDAGSGYLQVGDDLWYYSPTVGTAVALPAIGLTQALFGAGPSLGDLAPGTLLRDFDAHAEAILGPTDEPGGYLLTLVPRPEAPVVYGKLEVTVTADYVLSEIVYYDQRGGVVRAVTFGEPLRVGDVLFPTEVVVVDANGDRAIQRILDPEFEIGLDASFFTVERLEGGK